MFVSHQDGAEDETPLNVSPFPLAVSKRFLPSPCSPSAASKTQAVLSVSREAPQQPTDMTVWTFFRPLSNLFDFNTQINFCPSIDGQSKEERRDPSISTSFKNRKEKMCIRLDFTLLHSFFRQSSW